MEAVGVAAGVASVASIARWIAVPWLRSNAKDLSEDATIDGSDEDGLQGLKVEHDPKSPEVDICFVHGLTGDARSTWTAQSKDTGQDVFWPTDLLTNTNALNENAFPQARIMLYGYETDVNSLCWLTERTLYHHGKRFLRMLTEKRAHCKHRPLLFVAHSLGGLLVKSSLIFARNVKSTSITDEREIYLSTFGVISFGTPQIFTGKTSMSLSDVVDRICQLRASTFEDSDSSTWENDVRNLETRLGRYKDIAKDIPEVFCYESSRTNGSYVPLCTRRILPPKQDVHEFCEFVSIEADHINMCKFTSSSRQYRRIEELIRKLFDLSSSLLGKRRERYAKTHQSTITLPRRALDFGFAVDPELPPRGRFVPRTDIVSRQDYLDVLDQRLRNTRFAVLTGPHGHGKTSLAREYAWLRSEEKQERSFKSIFWLDAASELTLEVSFIKAIRQLRRYYGRDIIRQTDRDPESEIIHVLDSIKATEDDVPLRKEDRRYAIRAFMDWLSFPENKDWLLIYDDAEELHAPYLQGFLPPIEPQRGYIIMTSREDHTKDYESLEGQISVEPFKRTYSAMSSSPVAGSVSRFTVSTSRAATSEAIESSNSSSHPHLTRESASEQLHFLGPSAMDRPQSTRSGSVRRFAHIRVGSFPLEDPMETSQTFHDRGRSPPPEGGNLTRRETFDQLVDVLDNDIASDFSHFGGQFDSFDDPLPRVQQERDFDGSDIDDDFEEPPQELVAWLDACTMLSCDPIPRRLIQAGFDVDKEAALSGLDKLNSDGWVRISQERDTFIIPITRRRLRRQQLEAFDKAASSARIALTAIVATFKQVSSDSASRPKRTVYERILLRHIDACLEIYQKWKAVLDCEWDVLAEVCEKHGLFEEASTFFQAARDYPLDRNDSQGHLSSSFITGLERVTNDDGWDETESMISADQRKLTEPSHPTPTVHKAKSFRELQSELGRIRMQVVLGRFRDLNKQCEDMLKEIEYGQDDGRFRKLKIEALRQMVSITNAQHDWTKSIETSYELIGMLERELGPSADDTVWAVHELARIHLSQEDYGGAEPLLEQVLMVRQREFGNSYPGTIAVSEDLARSYREQGQLNNALDAYLRILKIYRDLFGEEHIQTAKVKENLAIVRDMMGKHEAADHLYDSALHVAGLLGVESEDYQAMLERYDNRQKAIQEKQEEEKMLEEERVGMASVNPAIPSRTDSTPSAWVMVKSISAFQSKAGR